MSDATMIYCLKAKAERKDMEKYLRLAKIINRQGGEGAGFDILGLYEAKKAFRCDSTDPCQRGFRIAKGEYFLLVNGETYDATVSRLHRAIRTPEERLLAWPRIGIPDNAEKVYASADDDWDWDDFLKSLNDDEEENDEEESADGEKQGHDENDYIRNLGIEIPEYEDEINPPELVLDNHIMTYEIREGSDDSPEATMCIDQIILEDLAGKENLQEIFKKLVQCKSVKMIPKVKGYETLVEELIRGDEIHHMSGRETPPHNSLVLAIVDGKTSHMQCGIWCYKREAGKPMEIHLVDCFLPDCYEYDAETKNLIPQFEN